MNKIDILNEISDLSEELKVVQSKLLKNPSDKELNKRHGVLKTKMDIAHSKWSMGAANNGFDSSSFIAEMESLESVEETPLSYEDYEDEMEQITERELRGDI